MRWRCASCPRIGFGESWVSLVLAWTWDTGSTWFASPNSPATATSAPLTNSQFPTTFLLARLSPNHERHSIPPTPSGSPTPAPSLPHRGHSATHPSRPRTRCYLPTPRRNQTTPLADNPACLPRTLAPSSIDQTEPPPSTDFDITSPPKRTSPLAAGSSRTPSPSRRLLSVRRVSTAHAEPPILSRPRLGFATRSFAQPMSRYPSYCVPGGQ